MPVKDLQPICMTWFAETALSKCHLAAGMEVDPCPYPERASVCRTEAREVPVRLTCCRELGGRELRRRFATHPPASLVREECALLFLIRTHILKVYRSHLIAKNC